MLGWRKTAGLALAAWLAATGSAAAEDKVEAHRAEQPSFRTAWLAYQEGDGGYFSCVEEAKKEALAEMWRRRAPLEGGVYAMSRAYRECEGFATFWPQLYLAGFDSPEQWIEYELRLLRAAAIAEGEIDPAELTRSRNLLRDAIAATTDSETGAREERLHARDVLLGHHYAATAISMDRPVDDDEADLVDNYPDLLRAALPEGALDAVKAAVNLASSYRRGPDIAANVARTYR